MKRLALLLTMLALSCFGLLDCASDPPPVKRGPSPDEVRVSKLVASLKKKMQENEVPGAALVVVKRGKIIHSSGYGVRSRGKPEQVNGQTLFQWGAISKTVTAATTMVLIEDGLLRPTTPIDVMVRGFKVRGGGQAPTIADLMTETSGIPDWTFVPDHGVNLGRAGGLKEYLTSVGTPLWTSPGRIWNPSNLGYSTLGVAIEEASGKSFNDVAHQKLFVPAKMETATFDPKQAATLPHALGHPAADAAARIGPESVWSPVLKRPFGGLQASSDDMGRFLIAMTSGKAGVLTPQTVSTQLQPKQLTHRFEKQSYAAGWFRETYRGHDVAYRDGTLSGFAAFILMAPADQFGVAVVWNSDVSRPDDVVWDAADAFLPDHEDTSRAATNFANFDATHLVGTYDGDTPLGSVEILDGATLRARFLDYRVTRTLKRISPDTFVFNLPAELASRFFRKKERLTFWFRGGSVWIVSRVGVAKRALVNTQLD